MSNVLEERTRSEPSREVSLEPSESAQRRSLEKPAILDVHDVTVAYHRKPVLWDVDLVIREPRLIGIIGPNGAGKTTLLNLLTGFLRPDSGRCLLGGRETTHLAPHRIARLGVGRTFQDLRLIEQVPGLENVMLARPNQRGEGLMAALLRFGVAKEEAANREEAMRLLRFVGLADKAAGLAGELSYGEQKLLTIACCLATEARILFFDEPVTGVHPEIAGQILDLLRRITNDGKLVVFIEHDISAVRRVADLVIVMDDGRVITQGPPSEVLERPEILEAYVG
ncbi:MAG: ATP-binding cassette domain-containing protein [Planctomycetes bacterium]|nr:ATP-binding cassette domain-containing protein [Planctomycetota bacterium]